MRSPLVAISASAAVLAAGLLIALPASALTAARAEDPITWSVEPSNAAGDVARETLAYAVDPGTQITDYVAVSNFGEAPVTFDLYATDALNDFETGAFGLLTSDVAPSDVGAWITVSSDEVEVAPGQRAVVPFTLLVPSDAAPGDHTAGIIASVTSEADGEDGQAIALEQRVASRVYLRVSGDPEAAVEATGLTSGYSPSWNPFGGGTAGADFAVTNTGNVRVDVDQEVVVRGPFGIELGVLHGEPVLNLLPGQSAHVHLETEGVPPLALLWTSVELSPSDPTDRIEQSAEQDAAGNPVEPREDLDIDYQVARAETLTGAFSWTLLLVIVASIALIVLVVRYIRATRERFFEAIDEAREEVRRDAETAPDADADRLREPTA